MDRIKIEIMLKRVCNNGILWTHNKGYSWYNKKLLPAVEIATREFPEKKELLSDVWYIIGDIHDFNDAPNNAITAYKQSIQFDENHGEAYREIANMLERIGKNKEALKYINKSLHIDPNERNAISDKEYILSSIKFRSKPLYVSGDIKWKMNEQLATENFEFVINNLKQKKSVESLKQIARAYGALNMCDEYLRMWNRIKKLNVKFELEYADWFYMPIKVFAGKEIWVILKSLSNNIIPSIFVCYDSLYENYKNLSSNSKLKITCNFQIFKIEGNAKELKKMKMKFPKWKELEKC
ncbi:MAG: hypothetical protein ABI543_06325 [Ignavibacteria bacterium]